MVRNGPFLAGFTSANALSTWNPCTQSACVVLSPFPTGGGQSSFPAIHRKLEQAAWSGDPSSTRYSSWPFPAGGGKNSFPVTRGFNLEGNDSVYADLLNTEDSWWLCVLATLAAAGAALWAAQAAAGVVEGLAESLIHEEAEWQCAANLHRCRVAQHPCAGQSCAQFDRGLVHEVLPVANEDSHPPTTPVPWGAAE